MGEPVITVEKLSKRYTLRHQARSGLLRDKLASLLRNPFQQIRTARATAEEFWALRDINFSVNQGDVLGIIGRNGAGKSTLLKILSRITEPTTGRISIQGRVASLLEVGTGFHGELSGRENIFLNGAILGMTRSEIRKKFDEIVAFAEVDKFLDTPVKHYSSGMYVRLAFAVAAHLEPEILIVDEVLAVGDAAFQRKCLGKMEDVARKDGRTVLFVSHNLDAILRLCTRAILLQAGQLRSDDRPTAVANIYLAQKRDQQATLNLIGRPRSNNLRQRVTLISLHQAGAPTKTWSYSFGEPLGFCVTVQACDGVEALELHYAIFSAAGAEVGSASNLVNNQMISVASGVTEISFHLPHLHLVPGDYYLNLALKSPAGLEDFLTEVVRFNVEVSAESAKYGVDLIHAFCVPESTFTLRHFSSP